MESAPLTSTANPVQKKSPIDFSKFTFLQFMDFDPKTADPAELRSYIRSINERRGSSQTHRAATRRESKKLEGKLATKKEEDKEFSLEGLL